MRLKRLTVSKVVVLGGGLAGLSRAISLSREDVVLIDKANMHEYVPGTVQLLGGRIERESLEIDIEEFLSGTGVDYKQESVVDITPGESKVTTDEEEYSYDHLIVALGSEPGYSEELGIFVDHVYDIESTLKLKEKLSKNSSISVVGGGYVGVEVAGELADNGFEVNLVSESNSLIAYTNKAASDKALECLREKGVAFYLDSKAAEIKENNRLILGDGRKLSNDIVVWCCGGNVPKVVEESFETDERGVKVDSNYVSKQYGNVECIGSSSNKGWWINKNDVVTVGDDAIFIIGQKAYCSSYLRIIEDFVRWKYFLSLYSIKLKAVLGNYLS